MFKSLNYFKSAGSFPGGQAPTSAVRRITLWLIIFSLLVAGAAGGESLWASEATDIRSIRANFVQKNKLKMFDLPLVSRGRFVYQAPDSIRWEYTTPRKSVILLGRGPGRRFTWQHQGWVVDWSFRPEVMEAIWAEMLIWLTGRTTESKDFQAEIKQWNPKVIQLSPRDEGLSAFVEEITVTFTNRPGVIEEIEIVEGPNATTRLIFEQIEINVDLPDDIFENP